MDCTGPKVVRRLLEPIDVGVAIDAIRFEKERLGHRDWGDEGPSRKPPSYRLPTQKPTLMLSDA